MIMMMMIIIIIATIITAKIIIIIITRFIVSTNKDKQVLVSSKAPKRTMSKVEKVKR